MKYCLENHHHSSAFLNYDSTLSQGLLIAELIKDWNVFYKGIDIFLLRVVILIIDFIDFNYRI